MQLKNIYLVYALGPLSQHEVTAYTILVAKLTDSILKRFPVNSDCLRKYPYTVLTPWKVFWSEFPTSLEIQV